MSEQFSRRVSIVSGYLLLAVAVFSYGLAVERYQVWPYYLIHESIRVAKSYAAYGQTIPEGRRVLAPAGASREHFTVYRDSMVNDGYYFFTGWRDDVGFYGSWLYDSSGTLLHTWEFDYYALDPDGPWNGETHPHPAYVLEDGSLIVAFDSGDIMARLDTCSEPVWVKSGIYHHSLARAGNGSFWTWRGEGTPYGHYHYVENFDPRDGSTIDEIALVEDIIATAGERSGIFGVRPDFRFLHFEKNPTFLTYNDIFHPNDVEALSEGLAPQFPMFSAGDLLLSLRNIDLVAVVDPVTHEVKWWSRGPWIEQHDPDFTRDGKISVFNNNPTRSRSEIVKIDPATGEFVNELFHGELRFHTETMGKHQYLPNGNVLLVVPDEGRALEATSDGQLVLEFNNLAPGSPAHNDHVEDGMWVPADYFESVPVCNR